MANPRHEEFPAHNLDPFWQSIALGAGLYQLNATKWTFIANSVVTIEVTVVLHRASGSDSGMLRSRATFRIDALGTAAQVGMVDNEYHINSDLAGASLVWNIGDEVSCSYHHLSANSYYLHYSVIMDAIEDAT